MTRSGRGERPAWPEPGDFAAPPTPDDHARWAEADRVARPARLARLRARFEAAGIDTYFGLRREHMRYLTGFTLGEGEEKLAGTSGQFLVGREDLVVLADSRYTIQAHPRTLPGIGPMDRFGAPSWIGVWVRIPGMANSRLST